MMIPNNEVWIPVIGFEEYYAVSNLGFLKRLSRTVRQPYGGFRHYPEKLVNTKLTWDGYYEVGLYARSERRYFRLHRLVAKAFVPNPDNKPQVNHKDGNKLNNCSDNLEWVTHQENMDHAYSNGLIPIVRGSDLPQTKLTEEDVKAIRIRIQNGEVQRRIAEDYQVHPQLITMIKQWKIWKHVP